MAQVIQTRKTSGGKPTRLPPLDALRGVIIILMALDHANYFVAQQHSSGEYWGGPMPVYPDALSFLTRLVTHLAAPGFFFLLGAGMVLFANTHRQGGWSRRQVIIHFLLRGLLLIALQFLVVNRAWELTPGGWQVRVYVGVLYALGTALMVGSVLVWLQPQVLLLLTLLLLVVTQLLVPQPGAWGQLVYGNSLDYLNPFLIRAGGTQVLWSNYPLLPWLGLVTLGMFFSNLLLREPKQAYRNALLGGAALLLGFVMVRALDGFGNIRPRAGDTWIDFFNLVKYPPSITFTLLTTGLNLILLGMLARLPLTWQRFLRPLVVFGQVPLFFYLMHLFLYIVLGRLMAPDGTSIPRMLPIWLLGLLLLYPLCLWFGRLKHAQPSNSVLRFI